MITTALVKTLRERTGAGVMDCKVALEEVNGDLERAVILLRERGMAAAQRKAVREAREGVVESYVHFGGRIGVLVEVLCETDFVARNERFRAFAHDLALQVAAARPQWVGREDIPGRILEEERAVYRQQALNDGKSGPVVERIAAGRLEKFVAERCLLEQTFIKDPDRKVKDLVTELIALLGENVRVGRFARLEVGES
ncbi:MAG: translation elongation factor Ts [bacterium]|nr:translation elongation factor Ts [bacterium]